METKRWDERSSGHTGLMRELEDVAHGLRIAANALNEEHALMASYATRAADFVEGAGEKLKKSPRLAASLDQLRHARPKALSPSAALLGFVGTRILNGIGGSPAEHAQKRVSEALQREDDAQADNAGELVSVQLSSADWLEGSEAQRGDDWQPTGEPGLAARVDDAVFLDDAPTGESDPPPAREDEPSSATKPDDGYASRY